MFSMNRPFQLVHFSVLCMPCSVYFNHPMFNPCQRNTEVFNREPPQDYTLLVVWMILAVAPFFCAVLLDSVAILEGYKNANLFTTYVEYFMWYCHVTMCNLQKQHASSFSFGN